MKYAKLIAPLLGGLVMAGVVAYRAASEDNVVTPSEWVLLVVQVLMVVSVWGAANIPGWTRGKTLQAAIFTVLALLASLVTNGISGDEWFQLVITGLSAVGVALTPAPLSRPQVQPQARGSGAGMASW